MKEDNPTEFSTYESPIIDIDRLCLMDDIALRVTLDNNPEMAKAILSPVLQRDDFEVKSAKTQTEVGIIRGHSVVFDCLIEFADGTVADLELQKAKVDMPLERMIYNRAMLVAGYGLERGKRYRELRHSIVVVLLDGDFLGNGIPLYRIAYCLKQPSHYLDLEPGQGIYIANTRDKDVGTALGQLMADITATDPSRIKDPVLSRSLEMLKSNKGREIMGTYYYETMKKYKKEYEAWVQKEMKEKYMAQWRAEGREKGLAEGRAEGRAEGIAEGRAEGIAEGRAEGIAEGRAEGIAEGRDKGMKVTLVSLYRKNLISAEDAAAELSISVEAFLKLADEIAD